MPEAGRSRAARTPLAVLVVASAAALVAALLGACTGTRATGIADTAVPDGCPADAHLVSDAGALRDALAGASAGTAIALAPGTYAGRFTAAAAGTREQPITLCGSADAVLDGGGVDEGYTLHLDGAAWWRVEGVTVTGGKKGVMVSGASDVELRRLVVHGTGDEGVHLRQGTVRTTLADSSVFDTGLREPDFGEGVYVGSAESNWCELTGCEPDRSDANLITGNTIHSTTAEAIDVKEGTSGGRIVDNDLLGPVGAAAGALIDVKGDDWLVEGNRIGVEAGDGVGVRVQEVLPGWGAGTVVRDNAFGVGVRLGVQVRDGAGPAGTVVACGQSVERGELSDVGCE